MDLALIMSRIRPGENVASDLSSYEKMVASWRGAGQPPSMTQILNEAKKDDDVKYIEDRKKALKAITLEDKVLALWAKAKGDDKLFDDIEAAIVKAEQDFPKP